MSRPVPEQTLEAVALYLNLLKKCLTGSLSRDELHPVAPAELRAMSDWLGPSLLDQLSSRRIELVERRPHDPKVRADGRDWPVSGETMMGLARLNSLQNCVESVIADQIEGDLIETGVWRGGGTILMRAVLKIYGAMGRKVWVADSFEGLPPPDVTRYPQDAGDTHHTHDALRVSIEEVQANFAMYGLLDESVCFLKGWFKDTLPAAPIGRIAVMRLDGDMYESTMDALVSLYPKLSVGGYAIIDDYGYWEPCRRAVHDYREANGITDPIEVIDWTGAYWRRT